MSEYRIIVYAYGSLTDEQRIDQRITKETPVEFICRQDWRIFTKIINVIEITAQERRAILDKPIN